MSERGAELEVASKEPELSRADRTLVGAATAAPVAWLLQLTFGIGGVRLLCAMNARWPLYGATAVALAVTVTGAWICWRRLGAVPGEEGSAVTLGARRAVAVAGLGLASLFGLLILTTAVPGLFLEPCR